MLTRIYRAAESLAGVSVHHFNTTAHGGGVAELLESLLPLMEELGIPHSWKVIPLDEASGLFAARLVDLLQGMEHGDIPEADQHVFLEKLRHTPDLQQADHKHADIYFIHDFQLAPLATFFPWMRPAIWMCHVDTANPDPHGKAYIDQFNAAGLFNPLSYPIRRAAKVAFGSFDRQPSADARSDDAIREENSQLRQQIAQLTATVEALRKIDGDRRNLGDLKSSSMRLDVAGADAAGRDVLLLKVSPLTQLVQDSPVYSPVGLVGRLDAGRGGARVRLITDDGFAVTGTSYGFRSNGKSVVPTAITAPTPLAGFRWCLALNVPLLFPATCVNSNEPARVIARCSA